MFVLAHASVATRTSKCDVTLNRYRTRVPFTDYCLYQARKYLSRDISYSDTYLGLFSVVEMFYKDNRLQTWLYVYLLIVRVYTPFETGRKQVCAAYRIDY